MKVIFRWVQNRYHKPVFFSVQSQFLHRVALYLSSDILPTSDYETTINSLHTSEEIDQSQFKALLIPELIPPMVHIKDH